MTTTKERSAAKQARAAADHLTGNDVALAASACALAIAWWQEADKKPRSQYARRQMAALKALSTKLQYVSMNAYPHIDDPDDARRDEGDEKILKLDTAVMRAIRKAREVSQ